MELIVNPIFCDEIFCVIKTFKLLLPCVHPYCKWATKMVKEYNIHSPITLQQNSLALKNLAQMCSFNSLQFHKHFGIKAVF